MLSFNIKFGMGAQLRQRPIWTGPLRSIPAMVARQVEPYVVRDATNPTGQALDSIAYNGTLYAGVNSTGALYTSPDLVTLTSRNAPYAQHNVVIAVGNRFFARGFYSGGSGWAVLNSIDGATWGSTATAYPTGLIMAAGGIGYILPNSGSANFDTVNAAGVVTNRAFAQAGTWSRVVCNGTKWFAIGSGGAIGNVSDNGTTFANSTGFAAAAAKLTGTVRYLFTVGNRFVVVSTVSGGTAFSSMYSEDGQTWVQGARYSDFFDGRTINALHHDAVEIDGFLYVAAAVASNAAACMLSTSDGVKWRTHSDYVSGGGITLGGLYRRPGADSILFNAVFGAAPSLETNLAAKELYYEL
ncbi:MAG: hypothetical protein KKG67_20435 [Gammaproteobacteria bacterium]|nr:hypothetical protein [Gammaproteobacteria bacterium]